MTSTEQYTGPERRWRTRSLYDWTEREDHLWNQCSLRDARSIEILQRLHTRAMNRRNGRAEADAIWSGMFELKSRLTERRKMVAKECAPWFDGSAFHG